MERQRSLPGPAVDDEEPTFEAIRPASEDAPDSDVETPPAVGAPLTIRVASDPASTRPGTSVAVRVTLALLGTATLAAALALGSATPVLTGALFAVGVGLLLDFAAAGPLRVVRRLGADTARLRAALACPYCRDRLPEDAAVGCDRAGCGALYHEECWVECRASYGGCAIYGCGCTTGHPVGRFALRRHVLRLALAAALFPPKLVRRLQEREREGWRDVWARARRYQEAVSWSAPRTLLVGLVNLAISAAILSTLVMDLGLVSSAPRLLLLLIGTVGLPIVLMRLPLGTHAAWGVARLVARVFRDELAALRRADEGTFLARLVRSGGKKE